MMNKIISITFAFLLIYTGKVFGQEDQESGNQRAFYECGELEDVDTTIINQSEGKVYFQFYLDQKPRNLKQNGFVWYKNNPKNYFKAYLVNTSDSTLLMDRQDGSLLMIQEALDEEGKWQPIEFWVYSGCGNSYFNPLKLEPGKCVLVPIKKYSGDYKTKIRMKLKTNNGIFYSNSFEGSIEKSQFEKETNTVHGILYHGPANYFNGN